MRVEGGILLRLKLKLLAAYREKAKTDKSATPPDVDLALEPLVEVLEAQTYRTFPQPPRRRPDDGPAARGGVQVRDRVAALHEGYRIVEELKKRDTWCRSR